MSEGYFEVRDGPYLLSTDPERLDLGLIHRFLSQESHWAKGRTREESDHIVSHSDLVAGAYLEDGSQVACARLVTDFATISYLSDVFVLREHRGHGLGRKLVEEIVNHPDVVAIGRQLLATVDAHDFYRPFGFVPLDGSDRWMIRAPQETGQLP